jgi:heparin/heparan-sulfate lyase
MLSALLFSFTSVLSAPSVFRCQAEDARLNPQRVEVVTQNSFKDGRGAALKTGLKANTAQDDTAADLIFSIAELDPGAYTITTFAAVDSEGAEIMREATSKFDSLYTSLQIDDALPTSRVIFVPWKEPEMCWQRLGIFDITNSAPQIKLWLPPNVRLDRIEVRKFTAPKIPDEAISYKPSVVPGREHPRLWITEKELSRVRANLKHSEHAGLWSKVKKQASEKPDVTFPDNAEMKHNRKLEDIVKARAFVYLMTQDKKAGSEAVRLTREYIARVSFGNLLDITREIGAAIYVTSLVYDWCHELCSAADLELMRVNMMRLAREMECQWPPFRNSIVNGHGNEAMINRDLLSMAIAVYNEDPLPYQYCSYRILEELVPMRQFEYRSPRHNQGVGYASYRFGWEMHAAWLLRKLADREIFDPNLKKVPLYWLNMRLPDGEMLRDGDGTPGGTYYPYTQTALLCYAYNKNPVLKGEFQRQSIRRVDPILFLLLNDPSLRAEPDLNKLPLTIDFGSVLSGMITRTDWNMGTSASNTVVAEIKGGGYHFGNHQHADAGALQLYYRGLQIVDLGQYKFYGTPYDMNFNKRSIAHSMMLVVDPKEKFLKTPGNDGGSRFLQRHPRTTTQLKKNPLFHYGQKISCGFGPSKMRPDYSYYAAELSSAYSDKITAFTRSCCFLNLKLATHPACMIVLDEVHSADASFKKFWQVNTLEPPVPTAEGVQLHNSENGLTGRVDLCMLRPTSTQRKIDIKSGKETFNVFGFQVSPPRSNRVEAKGHRVLFSPVKEQKHDTFLTLIQTYADGSHPLPYELVESDQYYTLIIADRVVCMTRNGELLHQPLKITVPTKNVDYKVTLTALHEGRWLIESAQKADSIECVKGDNTISFNSKGGKYRITPTTL